MLTQTIEERYVDMKKLDKLLKELFGQQKCEVEVKDEYIVLTIPKKLDKKQILSLHPNHKP